MLVISFNSRETQKIYFIFFTLLLILLDIPVQAPVWSTNLNKNNLPREAAASTFLINCKNFSNTHLDVLLMNEETKKPIRMSYEDDDENAN